jgi:hypothetical protein
LGGPPPALDSAGVRRLAVGASTVVFGLALGTGHALATPPAVRLELVRGPGAEACVDAGRLERMVERRLGRRVFDTSPSAELELRVRLSAGSGWKAVMNLSDSGGLLGIRELSTAAPHCSSLDDSVALVVALLVDTPPERPERTQVPAQPAFESKPGAEVRRTTTARPTRIVLPEDTFAGREPMRWDVRAGGIAVVGILPGIAPGFGLSAGLRWSRGPWIRLLGELFPARDEGLVAGTSGASFSLVRAGAEVCAVSWKSSAVALEACMGQRVGRLRAAGFGFDANRETARFHYSLAAGGNAAIPLSPAFGIEVGLRAELPLLRDRFTARADEATEVKVFQGFPVGGIAAVGFRFEM